MAIKVSRGIYPGTFAEYLVWAAGVKDPYCTILREEREITREEAIALGYAILEARPFGAASKHVLTSLFYAIMDDPSE